MLNYLDDFVCDLQCEDFYLSEEDWNQIIDLAATGKKSF